MTAVFLSQRIGLLASGGLDSCILLGHLLEEGQEVQPFYVRSGLAWQVAELAAMRRFMACLRSGLGAAAVRLADLVVLEMPLEDLYSDHWSLTGRNVPDATTPDEAVFLPGRNLLLTIKPALWCQEHGIDQLALATLRSNPFPDATAEFFSAMETALSRGLARPLQIVRPLAKMDKAAVLQLGRHYPLTETFSCIAPIGELHCGACNKCAERKSAFRAAELADPTVYAPMPRSAHHRSRCLGTIS
jgi:7-cyano-7-deazaguanine synthase